MRIACRRRRPSASGSPAVDVPDRDAYVLAHCMEDPKGYPRPQLRRSGWQSLNGEWEFAIDREAVWRSPSEVRWDKKILVPFSPETVRSGVHDTSLYRAVWYRRRFARPPLREGERLLLHFGAVDNEASVWVDGQLVVTHRGGYTPFCADVTDVIAGPGPYEIVVRAFDDPADLAKPRGKQDWLLEPHSIWYPRTTGIWQTVWLERVPPSWIGHLRWTSNLQRWEISLEATVAGDLQRDLQLRVRLTHGDLVLANDTYAVTAGEVTRRIGLSDPGIDDSRNALLWNPRSPRLIDAELELLSGGEVIDRVESYTALRSIAVQGDRIVLNGRPHPLRMVLDQGYWPETGITAPDDAAMLRDVELARAMGFNAVRKHQKIEDPRYLYWADRLGLMVWEEMPSAYRFTKESVERTTTEWLEALKRDFSHPCIIAWVPINESWGVPNLPDNPSERHYVQALYHLTKTFDPSRLVIGNDGWESVATDVIGIHDYDDNPQRIALRYHSEETRPKLFRRERPGGRILVLDGHPHSDHPIVLSEFGGIALAGDKTTWGYSSAGGEGNFAERFKALLEVVRRLDMFSGFCYTQFADTYQEANGLLYADRRPKIPLDEIKRATRGPEGETDWQLGLVPNIAPPPEPEPH